MKVKVYLSEDGVCVVPDGLEHYVVDSVVLKECTFGSDHVRGELATREDNSDFLMTYSKVVKFSNAPSTAEFVAAQINPDGSHLVFAHSSTPFE